MSLFPVEALGPKSLLLGKLVLGNNVIIHESVNIYGCGIGDDTRIGSFVEIQKGVEIGARCKISSHTFICMGVTIQNNVFIGHGVMFTNDRWPKATDKVGRILGDDDWQCLPILIKQGASIGSGSTVLGGVIIGENAMVGAGSVVTGDVEPNTTVVGNPARRIENRIEPK